MNPRSADLEGPVSVSSGAVVEPDPGAERSPEGATPVPPVPAGRKRILFVDDEPRVLDGLRRMLHGLRSEWELHFAKGGEAAIRLLELRRFDIVISDMCMPGLDGAALLTWVMEVQPHAVRIILSGQSDLASLYRSVDVSHYYLSKPCDAERIRSVIRRASNLRELFRDAGLAVRLSGLKALPDLPGRYREILEELRSSRASPARIADIVGQDRGLAEHVLQFAGSAFSGKLGQTAGTVQEAVARLGANVVRTLVLAHEILSQPSVTSAMGPLWRHCLQVGAAARELAVVEGGSRDDSDQTFMAGALHGVGKAALIALLAQEDLRLRAGTRGILETLAEVERDVLGTTHAILGGYLLGIWGLSDPVVEAVAYHHSPRACTGEASLPLLSLHVVDAFLHEPDAARPNCLDAGWIERIGLSHRVDAWREIASRQPGSLQ